MRDKLFFSLMTSAMGFLLLTMLLLIWVPQPQQIITKIGMSLCLVSVIFAVIVFIIGIKNNK